MEKVDKGDLVWMVSLVVGCVLLAVVLMTCEPPREPRPENMVSGPPGPEDLDEQWELLKDNAELFPAILDIAIQTGDPEPYHIHCLVGLMYGHQYLDMLMESAYGYEKLTSEERADFLIRFAKYLSLEERYEECRDSWKWFLED